MSLLTTAETRLIDSLDDVAEDYDALLVDLWGCYHNGLEPYGAAIDTLRRFRARGGIVVLLTNAPRPACGVARFLAAIGAPEDTHDAIMSSGEACQRAMRAGQHGRAFHYVGPERDLSMLGDLGLAPVPVEAADAVLLVGFEDDQAETPESYDDRIATWKARGLPLLCANPDIVVDRGDERLWCAGAIAERYEQAGGAVIWYGKPHPPSYTWALGQIAETAGREIPRARILAMGDSLHHDVEGANAQGIDALWVTGGIATAAVASPAHPDPDHPDPARVEALLATEPAARRPRYAIGRLR
ncbi:MAG: TIGR01459 family HAD-type hydrolase [Pseudomonadota bacterium]